MFEKDTIISLFYLSLLKFSWNPFSTQFIFPQVSGSGCVFECDMYSLWRFNPELKPIMENIIWWQTRNFWCFAMLDLRLSSVQFFLKIWILVDCLVHRSSSFRTQCLVECETCSFHVCMYYWTNSDHGEQVFGDREIVVGVIKCGIRLKPVSSNHSFRNSCYCSPVKVSAGERLFECEM